MKSNLGITLKRYSCIDINKNIKKKAHKTINTFK